MTRNSSNLCAFLLAASVAVLSTSTRAEGISSTNPARLAGPGVRTEDDGHEEDPDDEEDDEDEGEDLDDRVIEPDEKSGTWLRKLVDEVDFGLEADLEYEYEDFGNEATSEFTFDNVEVSLDGEWWSGEIGIKYQTDQGSALKVEAASLRIGGTQRWPWFSVVGRTVVPFAEFDALFVTDPMTMVVGETDEDAIIVGLADDSLEGATAIFRGPSEAKDPGIVASASIRAAEDVRVGLGWSSDLTRSAELREIHEDRIDDRLSQGADPEELGGSTTAWDPVMGLGASLSIERGELLLQLAHVTALESFDPGYLKNGIARPAAWNFEVGVRPMPRWLLAGRLETSHDLPQNPTTQYGAAVEYRMAEPVGIALEYLRGESSGGDPARNLVAFQLSLEL